MSLNRHVLRLFLCHVCQMNFGLITRNPVCTHVYVPETGEEGGEGGGGELFAQQVNHRIDELKGYFSNDSFFREVR